MKEKLIIIFVIIGALIGAGFASGQEIYSFFYSYGEKGFLGIIVMSILISILIYKTIKIIYTKKIDNYEEFLEIFIKNKIIIKAINIVLNILLLMTFYIMIAGFGAYFEQELGISSLIGSIILMLMCLVVFLGNVKGVLKVNEYLIPILIIFIMIIGAKGICTIDIGNVIIPETKRGWLLSSIIYCSYNLILLIPVLISIRKHINKEDDIKYISVASGIILFILSIIVFLLLTKSKIDLSVIEMPAVYIVRNEFPLFNNLYAFVILSSIFTTAISIGIGLLKNISTKLISYKRLVVIMCISSLLISKVGFSNLINIAYPMFGYIGILQIIFILISNKK